MAEILTEREVLVDVLALYKDFPCLWDTSHELYCNRDARYQALEILRDCHSRFDRNITVNDMKKKIENMRAAYRRERKKIEKSKSSGARTEEIYTPSLWYYQYFTFLHEKQNPAVQGVDNYDDCNSGSEIIDSSLSDDDTQNSQSSPSNAVSARNKKKKRSLAQKQENILNMAEKALAMKEEDWECLGRSIGLQLRDLNDKSLTIVQKLIADAIYYAKIGRLTEDSYIVLGSNPIRPISSQQRSSYLRSRSSLSLHSPSPPLYGDASSSPSSTNPLPSHQINRIQLSCPSPQYQNQLPQQSPQYQILLPSQSPQYQVQLPSPSPQYQVQLPSQSQQYQVQVEDSSGNCQLHIPESSHGPTNTTGTVITQENDLLPLAFGNILRGTKDKDLLIFKKNNKYATVAT